MLVWPPSLSKTMIVILVRWTVSCLWFVGGGGEQLRRHGFASRRRTKTVASFQLLMINPWECGSTDLLWSRRSWTSQQCTVNLLVSFPLQVCSIFVLTPAGQYTMYQGLDNQISIYKVGERCERATVFFFHAFKYLLQNSFIVGEGRKLDWRFWDLKTEKGIPK